MRSAVLVLSLLGLAFGAVRLPHLGPEDVVSLSGVFERAVKEAKDLAPAHYGAGGFKLLSLPVPDAQRLCEMAKAGGDGGLEDLHHAASLAAALPSCAIALPKAQAAIDAALAGAKPTAQSLFFAASLAQAQKLKLDNAKLSTTLKASTAADDGAANLGWAFHAASFLSGDVSAFAGRIEYTVAQADEVDSQFLQYEGGLGVTAITVSGIYALADKSSTAPGIKADEALKFANFLLSRRGVQLARPAFHLLDALTRLTSNKFHVPVSVFLDSNVAVSAASPDVVVGISNVLGKGVGALSVSLDSATHVPTSGVVLSKKALAPVAADKTGTRFSFKLTDGAKIPGFYKLSLTAASNSDKRLVGTQAASLSVKFMSELAVDGAELSIQDRDVTTGGKTVKLEAGKAHSGALEANSHQKIAMKFSVKDKTAKTPMTVHQAFVVFTHKASKQEIIFVAEAAKDKTYKFDVDLGTAAKDFDNLSGDYEMRLILGDSVVHNPLNWALATVKLSFPAVEKAKKARHEEVFLEPRKEIKHLFRVPEKRPPQFISDAFTIAALAPALLLLILWLAIGVNISNFPFSLWAIGFHVGLGGILGCYWLFWVKLNMFTTLKYVAVVGTFTFLTGNRMLRGIAEARKPKTE